MFLVVSNQIIKMKLLKKTEFDFDGSQKVEPKVNHRLISPIIVVGHFRITFKRTRLSSSYEYEPGMGTSFHVTDISSISAHHQSNK